jgi:hypothetical protein
VVEGNITSVARFESYAVQPPKEIEDDGYDPRYDDSESNNSFDSTGYELSGSYNDSSIEEGGGSGVEKRLSASLEAGKYGTGFQQHMTSFGNNQDQSGIKTASHHM